MKFIDINCDMGEGFGGYEFGRDGELLQYVSSANVACGYHASDPLIMDGAVAAAVNAGVAVGAHPGFPDLMGFGRRNMAVSSADAQAYILYQIGALDAFCRANGARMRHVKPHGALYNMAAADAALAEAVCEAVARYDESLIILGLSGSELIKAARRKGLRAASEVFADRAYEEDGSLRARSLPGAMIENEDEAAARAVRMVAEGKVRAFSGSDVAIKADSICVHGDGPRAPEFAQKIRAAIQAAGLQIAPFEKAVYL